MSALNEIGFDSFIDFLGFVSCILYDLTPIFFNMFLDQNSFELESLSILSVFGIYTNASIYFFLGLLGENAGNSFVLRDSCNLIGTFLGLLYLVMYFYERYQDNVKFIILNYLLIIAISGIIIGFEYFFIISRYNIVYVYMFKWIGVFPNILEYFPIGYNLFYLIKNKKAYTFLVVGALFGLFNAVVWFIWAIITTIQNKDEPQTHSICANGLSIALLFLQFYIFCRYRRNNKVRYLTYANKYD
jgi:hypothetical protein